MMTVLFRLLILFALLLSAASFLTAQSSIRVDSRCSLADAIYAANNDRARGGCSAGYRADTIELRRDITLRDALPAIRSDITIYGNWHSVSGNNRYQILTVERGAELVLEDITLTEGRGGDDGDLHENMFTVGGAILNHGRLRIVNSALSQNSAYAGGAILNNGDLTVTDSVFRDNSATVAGAIDNWNDYASARIINSEFINNDADNYGGAIDNGGSMTVQGSAFYDNSAKYGGAINNFTALEASDSVFEGNRADSGGALRNSRDMATMEVLNSAISYNRARVGGAIAVIQGYANVRDSEFTGNDASLDEYSSGDQTGGAIAIRGEAHILNSQFVENYAGHDGGAVYISSSGQASISDSRFSSNHANDSGGGIHNSGEASLEKSEIRYGYASSGGGLYVADGHFRLRQSILADNATSDCVISWDGNLRENYDNHIADGSCNPRWSGSIYDGYCPRGQDRGGGCQIGYSDGNRAAAAPTIEPAPSRPVQADGVVVDPYCSLADAIDAVTQDRDRGGCRAGYGADTITLAQDVYLRSELPRIASNITLHGNGYTISGEGRYRIFTIESGGALSLSNVTLAQGYAADDGQLNLIGDGGAILNLGALDARDCEFRSNRAGEDGGAIRNAGRANISNCRFVDNSADRQTGGIYSSGTSSSGADSTSLSLRDSSFRNNRSTRHGGAIFVSGRAEIDSSAFNDNSAGISAGAIYSVGDAQINRSEFYNNRSQKNGGAVFNDYEAHISISDSDFRDNQTRSGGGGVFTYGRASATISGSRFHGNAADQGGGVMVKGFARGGNTFYGELSLRNNSFSNNRGGGCYIGEYGELRQNQGNSFDDGGCWR